MLTPAPAPWIVRGATFALWALAAGSAAYWGLKLSSATRPMTAPVAAPALSSRFQLVGVAAGASSGGGAAVISVDGKPARPFRVGSVIDEGLVLQSVHGRQAVIASRDGQPVLTLEIPKVRMDTTSRPAPMGVPQAVPPVPGFPPPRPVAPNLPPNAPQPVGEVPPQAPSEAAR